MKLHEYQSAELFIKYDIPAPTGVLVEHRDEAESALQQLEQQGVDSFVVKAQIHAGGRGKAGGVKMSRDRKSALKNIDAILGMELSTKQTAGAGHKVRKVLVTEAVDIDREFYVAITLDRGAAKNVIIASTEGGTDIEEVAQSSPEKIAKQWIDPQIGPRDYQLRALASIFALDKALTKELKAVFRKLYQLYLDTDASIVEINPLVITKQNSLVALDAKINIDDNADFRQAEIFELRDIAEEDPAEVEAGKHNLSYIKLDGNIGCMVNGAGLAMATMDIIKMQGGNPANFLDVGGGATQETVKNGLKIILSDKNVKSVLVNIFGGIVRCDRIANGIINAVKELELRVPIVIRLQGTNADLAADLIKNSGLSTIAAESFSDAAAKAVAAANS